MRPLKTNRPTKTKINVTILQLAVTQYQKYRKFQICISFRRPKYKAEKAIKFPLKIYNFAKTLILLRNAEAVIHCSCQIMLFIYTDIVYFN